MTTLWVLGQGGFSREIEALARQVDPGGARWSEIVRVGPAGEQDAAERGGDAVLGMGDPARRENVVASRRTAFDWPALVHESAHVGPGVTVEAGVVLAHGVVITVDAAIREFAALNLAVTVGHDADVGRFSTINPSAVVSGGVRIGDGCLIGAGAVILENCAVGDRVIVGAGAVVVNDVTEAQTVVGVPARPLERRKATS